jgi:site-specific DNA-methyltransferase (adenine-specific)
MAEYRNITEIKPNPKNPRVIKDDKFAKLVESLRSFPEMLEKRPLVCVTDVDGKVFPLGGNMRLKAANELKMKELPVVMADDWTEEQRQEFIIKDNVGFGEWNWDELQSDWDVEQLGDWGLDIPQQFKVEAEAEEDEFDVPEGGIETDIVLGDLFEIGEHRLLCGDSTDSDSVARLMDGNKADMVFTDPPYGIDYNDGRWDEIQKKHTGGKSKKFGKIIGDAEDFNPSFLLSYFSYCKEIFVWGMQYYPQHLGRGGCIVWNRKTESQKDVPYVDFELCWSKQERNKMAWITWGGFKNKEKDGERVHPTQKPNELAKWFFNLWGKENDLVADLFLGSGSTMVASHQLKRKCYGMELDPKYCQVIIDRMRKLDPTLTIKKNGNAI